MIGINKLAQDLSDLNYPNVQVVSDNQGQAYALIPTFLIPAGSFTGRVIELAIPAPQDFPRSPPFSIHIRTNPHLVPSGQTAKRNVIPSNLGSDWQYWSYQFRVHPENPTTELMSQINEVFRNN
jgi:hypothetical protein